MSSLAGAVDTVLAGLGPDRYLQWRHARVGDPFEVPGLGRVLFTGHPDGARDISSRAPPDVFAAPLPNPIAPLVGRPR